MTDRIGCEPAYRDLMSSASKPTTNQLIGGGSAVNADQLEAARSLEVFETIAGWDAYEVWRRFIKDARDRRRASSAGTHDAKTRG